MARPLLLLLACLAAPAAARDPVLNLPVDCTLGETCYIQNHMDHDAGPGSADFTCGAVSYDGHAGTDFALPSRAAMAAGVEVLAAAPGTVRDTRDGMTDMAFDAPGAPATEGRDCGNGVVIDHGGGWVTQYCHLRRNSVTVRAGQRVGKGTVLGQVGLSGHTQFPHVHLSVRHHGKAVDPFLPDGIVICGAVPGKGLWQVPIPYVGGGLIEAGVTTGLPEFGAIKAGLPTRAVLPQGVPGLAVWAHAFGVRPGDALHLRLDGPEGNLIDQVLPLESRAAMLYRALALPTRRPWPVGTYVGFAQMLRQGVPLGEARLRTTRIVAVPPPR